MACPRCGRALDQDTGRCPVCESDAPSSEALEPTPIRTVNCRVCQAQNVLPPAPTQCVNSDCRAVIMPNGESGVPHSYVRHDLASAGVWFVILGVISIVLRPLSTGFGVLLLLAGGLLLTVRTPSMYLIGALLGYAAGAINALIAIRTGYLAAGLLAAFCFWAAVSWSRSYRSLRFTVDV